MNTYNGIEYEIFGNGYTVFFEGDEIYFDTEEEVRQFIDENLQAESKCKCIDCSNKCYEYYNNGVSNRAYYEWTIKLDKCKKGGDRQNESNL